MACEGLCLFGLGSAPDGRAFRYKLLAAQAPAKDCQL